MGIIELVWLAIPLVPIWMLVVLDVGNIILYLSIVIRYGFIVISRWETLMIIVFVCGFLFFDSILVGTAGSFPQETFVALSRAVRLIMLLGLGWIGHAAIRRQELMKKTEDAIKNGGS